MAAVRAQAEAQAAKARLAYAEREMSIKVEKAHLEATLDVINLQKEADAAVAKAEVMESAAAQFDKAESKECPQHNKRLCQILSQELTSNWNQTLNLISQRVTSVGKPHSRVPSGTLALQPMKKLTYSLSG